MQFRKNKL